MRSRAPVLVTASVSTIVEPGIRSGSVKSCWRSSEREGANDVSQSGRPSSSSSLKPVSREAAAFTRMIVPFRSVTRITQAVVSRVALVSCSAASRLRRASYSAVTSCSWAANIGCGMGESGDNETLIRAPGRDFSPVWARHPSCRPRSIRAVTWVSWLRVSRRLSSEPAEQLLLVAAEDACGGLVGVDDLEPGAVAAQQQHADQRLGEVASEESLAGGDLVEQPVALGHRDRQRQRHHRRTHQVGLHQSIRAEHVDAPDPQGDAEGAELLGGEERDSDAETGQLPGHEAGVEAQGRPDQERQREEDQRERLVAARTPGS